MRKTRYSFSPWLVLCLLAATAGTVAAQTQPRVVLISIDGLMPETLRTAEQAGLRLPNLTEMRKGGAFAEGLVGVFPTVTYPSHTTMVTGREPSEHGIVGNQMFDPERRMNGAWFAFSELIKLPTLWDAARAAGMTTAAVSWPVTVGAAIDHNIPEFYPLRSPDLLMLQRAVSTPGLYAAFEKEHGPVKLGPNQDDAFRAAQATFILRKHKPRFLLLHLIDLDHEQHQFGPGSKEAGHALEGIDKAIGSLRQALRDAGTAAETRFVIVSDHGFWPVSQMFHPIAFLNSLGLTGDEAKPETWRVAAHSNGGSIGFVVKDPNDQEAQTLVRGALAQLQSAGRWGIDQILDREQLSRHKGYPHAFVAVSLARGFTNGSSRTGPWVTPSPTTKGMHGYLPGPVELDCTFLAFGPGIAPRSLPRGELKDVARTVAALLGVSLPSAAGRDLLAR